MNLKSPLPKPIVVALHTFGIGLSFWLLFDITHAEPLSLPQKNAPPILAAASDASSIADEPLPPPKYSYVVSIESAPNTAWLASLEENYVYRLRQYTGQKNDTKIELAAILPPGSTSTSAPSKLFSVPSGTILFFEQSASEANKTQYAVLLTPQNKTHSTTLRTPRSHANILKLRDNSLLVVGGIAEYKEKEKVYSNAVERINFANGTFTSEVLPDIPGNIRRDFSAVELSDGRVMILGGSSSQYIGNEPITADTYLLNLKAKTWQAGPRMLEARAGASATLLPDGTVLVAGGWTPKHTWSDGPSRSTEQWNPLTNSFTSASPLPLGIANQLAMWLSNYPGKQLLLAGGWIRAWSGNQSVLAYDVENKQWLIVGEKCTASSQTGKMEAIPIEHNGTQYLWCQSMDMRQTWKLTTLRIPAAKSSPLPEFSPDKGIALLRHGMAFLPPQGNSPGLAVGGYFEGADSAAVDAIWPDGHIRGLASLNHARRNAKVFRLNDGSYLVAGGQSGDPSRRTQHTPPLELLPASVPPAQARWLNIEFNAPSIIAMGSLNDGGLLALYSTGAIERLDITGSDSKPTIRRTPLPPLNRKRNAPQDDEIIIQETTDGRIIVAGGWSQYHQMALLDEKSFEDGSPDRFVGIGELTPSLNYEIYNPATNRWTESASSSTTSSRVTILKDGRVVKWGGQMNSANPWITNLNASLPALEISDTDGKNWQPLRAQTPPLIATDVLQQPPQIFVIQDELFLFGKHPTDVTPHYWRGNAMVQWFNTNTSSWETLWESGQKDDWYRDHIGRIIIRNLPNGKRVALPISGLSGNGQGG